MEICAKEFWLPKRGNTRAECDDAFHVAANSRRFAVADGATETWLSGVWAKQLVRAFTNGNLSIPLALEELNDLQTKWEKIAHRRPLPWYAEEKVHAGAFAAFVGIEFSEPNTGTGAENIWRATAVGDSCLAQIRANEILAAFPLADSGFFNNRPRLLSSKPNVSENSKDLVLEANGSWGCDDLFLLMTDALACWFFKEYEQGHKPWNILRDLDTNGHISFEEMISDLRSSERIKNDDVTLVRVDIIG